MPELPETTVISQDVAALAAGREVLRAGVFRPDVTNVEMDEFPRRLVGRRLLATGRRGKIIVLDFGDVVGIVHLVISGRVLRLPEWQEPDRMNTAVLEFDGGLVLAFGDADNDADMLRFAGCGVAVGPMTAGVREAADEVVPGVDEDGVARYVEKLLGDL